MGCSGSKVTQISPTNEDVNPQQRVGPDDDTKDTEVTHQQTPVPKVTFNITMTCETQYEDSEGDADTNPVRTKEETTSMKTVGHTTPEDSKTDSRDVDLEDAVVGGDTVNIFTSAPKVAAGKETFKSSEVIGS